MPFGVPHHTTAAVPALLLAATTAGCTHWKTQSVTPRELVTVRRPSMVRVGRIDGRQLVLDRPEIVGDTVYGAARGRRHEARSRPAVALSDIETVAIRGFDPLGHRGVDPGVGRRRRRRRHRRDVERARGPIAPRRSR
jgi:hypothetical protein